MLYPERWFFSPRLMSTLIPPGGCVTGAEDAVRPLSSGRRQRRQNPPHTRPKPTLDGGPVRPLPNSDVREVPPLPSATRDDRSILDTCQIVAYFNFVTRLAEGLGVELESYWRESEKL